MRLILIIFLFSFSFCGYPQGVDYYKTGVGFYELIGQSNCLGNELIASVPLDISTSIHNIHVYENNSGAWQTLLLGSNNSGDIPLVTGRYGIEGRLFQLLRDYYNADQYFVKTARGGSGLAIGSSASTGSLDWNQTLSSQMWSRSMTARNSAIASLNPNVKFKARIWIQGEQDATSSTFANAYQSNEIAFVNALVTNIPFIDFSLSNNQTSLNTTHRNAINTAKKNTSSIIYTVSTGLFTFQSGGVTIPNKVYIEQNEPVTSDNLHYSAIGYEKLAEHAFKVIKFLNNRSVNN